MSLTIYKSSAGSGKTYTLAKEYLRLALRARNYYQHILAVTFTNRAAQEMKERVLDFLVKMAREDHDLVSDFAKETGESKVWVKTRAQEVLTHLLHHYSFFNISTIDTFFHRVIRAFSREIGLQGSFGIELDEDKVAEFIASDIFADIDDPELKDWLVEFSGNKLVEGEGYEFRRELADLARQLFDDDFKALPKEQFQDRNAKAKIKTLKERLSKIVFHFEKELKTISRDFEEAYEGVGIDPKSFYRGTPIPTFFKNFRNGKFKLEPSQTVLNALEDSSKWTAKKGAEGDQVIAFAERMGISLMKRVFEVFEEKYKEYVTASLALENLYTMGLLSDLARRLQVYKQEQDVIMISDLPEFLSQIIDDSGSPFIYEKVGSRYQHFLIDEFQDTSKLQWKNFRPLLEESLASGHENIIVGDAKQSIYGWRGGDPTLLMQGIDRDFPQSKTEFADTNYRSAREVIEFNNSVFETLPGYMAESMADELTEKGRQSFLTGYEGTVQKVFHKNDDVKGMVRVEFIERGDSWKEEAMRRTVETIDGLLRDGHSQNDIAILVRYNKDAADLVDYVLEYRAETNSELAVISDDGMLIEHSPVVQLLLAAFGHLVSPKDDAILSNLVFQYREHVTDSMFSEHADFSKLSDSALPEEFRKHKPHLLHLPIYELTEVLVRTFGLNELKSEVAYLQAFQDAVLEFSKNNRSDVRMFLDWWAENGIKRSVKMAGTLGAVEIITSHKAKGLQYPIVLVPFCNYRMDTMSHTSWYDAPELEGFEEMSSVPVDYKAKLAKSAFSEEYRDELAKWHLESLNVLYVSFTRAERGLYVFCEPPPQKQMNMHSTASKLMWAYFEQERPSGWDPTIGVFQSGQLEVVPHEITEDTMAYNEFKSNKWSKKLTIRKTGRAYYDDEVEKQRNEGILLHQILSEIIHWTDTSSVLDRYRKGGSISAVDCERFERIFMGLWENDQVKSWFDGTGEVKTEVVVLPKDGETKRMDRVIIKDNKAEVIDFKSGAKKAGDEEQVKEYVHLLEEMGFNAEGYLLYLKTGEVLAL